MSLVAVPAATLQNDPLPPDLLPSPRPPLQLLQQPRPPLQLLQQPRPPLQLLQQPPLLSVTAVSLVASAAAVTAVRLPTTAVVMVVVVASVGSQKSQPPIATRSVCECWDCTSAKGHPIAPETAAIQAADATARIRPTKSCARTGTQRSGRGSCSEEALPADTAPSGGCGRVPHRTPHTTRELRQPEKMERVRASEYVRVGGERVGARVRAPVAKNSAQFCLPLLLAYCHRCLQLFNVSVCLRPVSDRGKISRQPQVKVIHVEHTTTVFPVVPSHKGFSSSVETGTETGTGMGRTGTVGDAPVKNH